MKYLKRVISDLYWTFHVARKAWGVLRAADQKEPLIGILADIRPLTANNLTDIIAELLKGYGGVFQQLAETPVDHTDWGIDETKQKN